MEPILEKSEFSNAFHKKRAPYDLVTFSNACEVSCRARTGEAAWPYIMLTIRPDRGSSVVTAYAATLGDKRDIKLVPQVTNLPR